MEREKLIKVLTLAESMGVIFEVSDNGLRDISFKDVNGAEFSICWYCNLMTLTSSTLSVWFTNIELSNTHPSYEKSISMEHHDLNVAFIGVFRK